MGDPLVDPAGVPPLGVVVRSNTGPSYKPRGTACISAICHQREEDSDTSPSPGSIMFQPSPGSSVPLQKELTLPCTLSPAALRPGIGPLPTLHPCPVRGAEPVQQAITQMRFMLHKWGRRRQFWPTS